MSRSGLIMSGAVIMGLGVLVTAASFQASASSGGGHVIAYGAIFFGLVRMIRGFAAPDGGPRFNDQMIGRDGPPDPRPQLAGAKCIHCQSKILGELEAVACALRNKPVHRDCRREHRADAHAKRPRAPYR